MRARLLMLLVLAAACGKEPVELTIKLSGALAMVRSDGSANPQRLWILFVKADKDSKTITDTDNAHSPYTLHDPHQAFLRVPMEYLRRKEAQDADGFALYPLMYDEIGVNADCTGRLTVTNADYLANVQDFEPSRASVPLSYLSGNLYGTRLYARLPLAAGNVTVTDPIMKTGKDNKTYKAKWYFNREAGGVSAPHAMGQSITVKLRCSSNPEVRLTRHLDGGVTSVRLVRFLPRREGDRLVVKVEVVNSIHREILALGHIKEKALTLWHFGWVYEASENQPDIDYRAVPHDKNPELEIDEYQKAGRPYCTTAEMKPPVGAWR